MLLILILMIFSINANNADTTETTTDSSSTNVTIDDSMADFCAANSYVIQVKHAFRVEPVLVVFLQDFNDTIHVFKLMSLRFNESEAPEEQLSFRSIEEWPQWNQYSNGTAIEEITDFVSVYRFVLPDKSSPLIFTTLAEDEKSFIAYEVRYDLHVNYIESIKQFIINIHSYNQNDDDRLNLRDFYQNFPINSEKLAKPIMSFPISPSFPFPQRALVYYSELDPDIQDRFEVKYKAHIIEQQLYPNGTIEWIFDEKSGECFELGDMAGNEISAAIPITGYIHTDHGIHFYMFEFDTFYHYAIRKISFEANGTIKPSSFDELSYLNENRELFLCKQSDLSIPEDTYPTISATEAYGNRKIRGWVYVILVLILIAICSTILFGIYWYIKNHEAYSLPFNRKKTESIEMTPQSNTEQSDQNDMPHIDDSDISAETSPSDEEKALDSGSVADTEDKERETPTATATAKVPLQSTNIDEL